VVAPAPLPEMVRRAAAEVPNLTLPAVPALWQAWQEADAVPPNTRLAISAGAPLPVALEQAVFGRTGLKIHNFYGSSECGGIAYDRTGTPRTLDNLVGSPMQNVQLSVGDQGCLAVRGRNVGETYWPEPELALAGGCFRTSDLAELTDGQVFLRGRAGDLINVAGRKVAPESIEQVLARHPAVAGCLVLGLPCADAQRGETIAAVVAARNGVAVETLRQFLLENLPAWQVPRAWRMVKTLAADQRGKISRARWREKWQNTRT
jgi:acyl-coenzyme A synthetase/AMP-(fatty) acid ligase